MKNRIAGRGRVLGMALVCLVLSVFSQAAEPPQVEWEKTFGGPNEDRGYCVEQTSDGGYIVAGYTGISGPFTDKNAYFIKTDANGNMQWEKEIGGAGDQRAYYVQQTTDGGYIAAGTSLIKTDANGNMEWEKPVRGNCVQQTSDGGYIVTGESYAGPPSLFDVYLIKTDSGGNQEWEKTFTSAAGNDDLANSVQQTSDGGYIVAARIGSPDYRVYLIKTDSSGNQQWERTFPGGAYSVQQTTDGGYLVTGWTTALGAGGEDLYLLKADSNGNKQWERAFGGMADDLGRSVRQTQDDGYVAAGWTGSFGAGDDDFYLVKTDASGNLEWEKTLGGTSTERAISVRQSWDGGYIVAGRTTSFGAGGSDVYLVKLARAFRSRATHWGLYE